MKNTLIKVILTGLVAGTMLSTPVLAQDTSHDKAAVHGEKHTHKMEHRKHERRRHEEHRKHHEEHKRHNKM